MFIFFLFRTQYYYWIIYEYFLPLKKKDEYFSEFTEIATEITSSLLDQWTRFVFEVVFIGTEHLSQSEDRV